MPFVTIKQHKQGFPQQLAGNVTKINQHLQFKASFPFSLFYAWKWYLSVEEIVHCEFRNIPHPTPTGNTISTEKARATNFVAATERDLAAQIWRVFTDNNVTAACQQFGTPHSVYHGKANQNQINLKTKSEESQVEMAWRALGGPSKMALKLFTGLFNLFFCFAFLEIPLGLSISK